MLTCLCTRAVHLELTSGLSSEQFILAMRTFIAIRGKPSICYSDNQSSIVLGESVINEVWNSNVLDDPSVHSYLATNGIQWKYIPQHAAWQGSFYERLVGSMKRCLRRTIGQLCLTRDQLRTLLAETSAVINSRPLVWVSENISDGYVITPQHFLSVNQHTGSPSLSEDQLTDPDFLIDISSRQALLDSWRKGSKYLRQFWDVWSKDYVLSLRERYQRTFKSPRIQASFKPSQGDIVLVSEKGIGRGQWKLGQIEEVNISHDDEIRSARVRTPNGNILTRPINELHPLECSDPIKSLPKKKEVETSKQNGAKSDTNLPLARPKRQAAISAMKKFQQQLLSF